MVSMTRNIDARSFVLKLKMNGGNLIFFPLSFIFRDRSLRHRTNLLFRKVISLRIARRKVKASLTNSICCDATYFYLLTISQLDLTYWWLVELVTLLKETGLPDDYLGNFTA